MAMQTISPLYARSLIEAGAALIDIREAGEHALERIPNAKSVPLSMIEHTALPTENATVVIFHCRSGNRTRAHAYTLGSATACNAYLLDGGIDAWKQAGLPVIADGE